MEETMQIGNIITMRTETQQRLSESQLVDEFGNSVYKFCRSITYTKDDAEDLFQDTFLQAFSQMQKVTSAISPQYFLLSTASYLWKSRRRKYARRSRLVPESEIFDETDTGIGATSMEEDLIAKDEQRIVRSLAEALPDKLKIPIVLYYTNELRTTEIAEILGIPTGTVKSRLHKARQIIEKGLVSKNGY